MLSEAAFELFKIACCCFASPATGNHGVSGTGRKLMAKIKKKLTTAEKRAKAEWQKKYMRVFINGKQVRVKRPETIDGMDMDEFIRNNADPVWLHQNELWEYIEED